MQGSPFPERSLDRLSCIPSRIPPKESTVILSPVLSFLAEKQSFPSLQLRNNQINSCSAPLMLDIGQRFLSLFANLLGWKMYASICDSASHSLEIAIFR